jgi:hypothetical protein
MSSRPAWSFDQLMPASRRVGWQPSRFHTDRAEAERAYQLAEQLGSVKELGTTWPSLSKAFTRHGLACPPATPRPRASAPLTHSDCLEPEYSQSHWAGLDRT